MSNSNPPHSAAALERSLPQSWERARNFNDEFYEWLERAPWLAISAAAHVIIVLICMAIPWETITKSAPTQLNASLEQAPVEVFEDPLEEKLEELEEELTEEPVIQEAEVSDHNEEDTNETTESLVGEPDLKSNSPFDEKFSNSVIGIGGPPGGKFGGRFGGGKDLRTKGGRCVKDVLQDGLQWLKWHQSAEGCWKAKDYVENCGKIGSTTCSDVGEESNNVGVTGVALLAFLGDGNTTRDGPYRENVARGIKWLKDEQDQDSGLIGGRVGHAFLYNHAIASLAMCEAYYFSQSPALKGSAQKSAEFIMSARNPYGAWRYSQPPTGENDTSVTGWMVFALKSAEEAKLKIDKESFAGALSWIDEVTDYKTGRVGYDAVGTPSSRVTRINDHFNEQRGESMTAVGLLCRVFMGQDPATTPVMEQHANLLAKALPKWDADPKAKEGTDFYYWYYGSYAMYQMGGAHWTKWKSAMEQAVVKSQRKEGDEKGSWDAKVDPWGYAGGRVYTTALGVLCLEVYYRYARVLGGR
jgi:hypothetical protein